VKFKKKGRNDRSWWKRSRQRGRHKNQEMKGIYRETCCCCCCCFVVGCESEGVEENQKEGEESRRD